MTARRSEIADIDAAIARGEWWSRLFDELADVGMQRVDALPGAGQKPTRGVIQTAVLIFRAVRLAVVAAMRLDEILVGLAALRARAAGEIAAARARARSKADEDTAAREQARVRASARREAREAEIHQSVVDSIDRAKPEPRDRDPLVEALDKRLAAIDPAIVDFDNLQLRETVLRICADLGVTPDWSRWEAGDWAAANTPAAAAPVSAPKPLRLAKSFPPPVLPDIPQLIHRGGDTALSRVLLAGTIISEWRQTQLE